MRPDAVEALRDGKARASLRRYFDVLEGRAPARFLVCKRVEVGAGPSSPDSALWREHEEGMRRFRVLLRRVDSGTVGLDELPVPRFSLLDLKVELAWRIMRSCRICERRCGVDRLSGEVGFCRVGKRARIASEFMHYGEEAVLVPSYTIFFAGCTFACVFCQNWDISQFPDAGVEASPDQIARLIERAKDEGARNVNWVGGNPDPNLATILGALNECDVSLSSVWNSNMYYSTETAALLSGTQDIYLTDFKWFRDSCALKYSKVPNYLEVVGRNHRLAREDAEMIIRHLVMPGHVDCCTGPILRWIAENLGTDVRVNIMDQYRPCYRANEHEEINRRITPGEYEKALELAKKAGLTNLEP
ncbi:MAG: radical SAM protein [Candidatus Hadarchaeales archaeon]